MAELLQTPLKQKHLDAGAQNVPFAGWEMPIQYDGIIKEHGYCRDSAALFDTSHMGEFFYKGDISASGINEATSINIEALPVGKCKYGFLLNVDGGVIDDLIVYRLSEDELMIVVNASRIELDLATFRERLSSGEMTNRSMEFAKIDLQGPKSKEILKSHFPQIDLDAMGFFSFLQTTYNGEYCLLSRTGYTGEMGFELYMNGANANIIWDKLIAGGAKPAGLGARDALRLEMGYSLYGNDLSETISPIEASLGMFINVSREYIGKDALAKQKTEGTARKLIPFKTLSRRSARKDFEVYQNDKKIGFVTSAAFSPILNVGIGLAMINIADFKESENFELRDARGSIEATKASLPFITK